METDTHHREAVTQADRATLLSEGTAQYLAGEAADCVDTLCELLRRWPKDAQALNIRGAALEQLDRREEALVDYEAAFKADAKVLDALLNRASCLEKLKRYEESASCYRQLLARLPHLADGHFGLGNALAGAGHMRKAEIAYRRAIHHEADHGLAWYNLGCLLNDTGRLEDAVDAFGQASSFMPEHAPTYNNCANSLKRLNRYEEALLLYDTAIQLDPGYIDALQNKAQLLNKLERWRSSFETCAELIKRAPLDARTHFRMGVALYGLHQDVAALDCFRQASSLNPDLAVAYLNEAAALDRLRRHEETLVAFEKVISLKPEFPLLLARHAYKKLYVCNWANHAEERNRVLRLACDRLHGCDPFRIIAFSDDAHVHRKTAEAWCERMPKPLIDMGQAPLPAKGQRIRIGYFSADFHLHATALLMAQFFELHDRSRFEVTAFSFGPQQTDVMSARLRRCFDRFLNVQQYDDETVVQMARELQIDIAVDLKGYTLESRVGIFQRRAAPIQVSYLGFPGSMGAPFIDYILADHTLVPDELRGEYTEKVIRLPGSYQVNDQHRQVSPHTPTRAELGLPDSGFVYCCFNNNYKITPEVFDVWMRLLQKTPGSVLWMLADNDSAEHNLKKEAIARGVETNRLVFARRAGVQEHLARQKQADLFLDTLPCNAHTTASDALWVGLPVLTCSGTAFASRVAASLLKAQGLDELITTDLEAYENMALKLAHDRYALQTVRERTLRAVREGRLFETEPLTRAIERAFTAAYERAHQGLAPDHFDV